MLLLDETSAAEWLRQTGRIDPDEAVVVRELSGGVSNVVLHVARTSGADFVLKQAREQLRVADPWFCPVERIWREVETLEVCRELLGDSQACAAPPRAGLPTVLFEDHEQFTFGMTSAPRDHRVWKNELLAGRVDPDVAEACGWLLAQLAIGGWRNEAVAARLGDRSFFEALRVEPYYRRVAEVHADLREPIERLIASLDENRLTLVHGDFSPKNLLLFDDSLWLIDCEVGHYGDPAFDLGFFLSHLVLKRIRAGRKGEPLLLAIERFWNTYRNLVARTIVVEEWVALEYRAVQNLAGCLLARIDGKSRVDYLDPSGQAAARSLARSLFLYPCDWSGVVRMLETVTP
jgi:5-methylthioribose kinase